MKKPLASLIALLFLTMALSLPALASGLTRALPNVDLTAFEAYSAFEHDEDTGEWTLRGNAAEALLRTVREGALNGYSGTGSVIFYLQIEGNSRTGLFAPYLYMEYVGKKQNATAVSFRVGDIRYDMPVHSRPSEDGSYEQLCALLCDEALEMLVSLSRAEQFTIRLHGENSYTSEIRVKKTYNNVRERLQAASLSCVDLSSELAALQYGEVHMKSEMSENWYEKTGVKTLFEATDLATETVPQGSLVPALDKEMKMLSTEHSNRNVKLLEDKLIEINYLAGTANNAYGTGTKAAVEDIQRLYGLVPTGSADGRILNLLFGDAAMPRPAPAESDGAEAVEADGAVDAEAGVPYRIDKYAEIVLNRYWFANTVRTKKPVSAMSDYSSANRDNLLLVVDGNITNLMTADMGFNRTISARAVYGGEYAYDMIVKCESDGGERFDTQLLPLGSSRVVLMAEVPKGAMAGGEGWTVELAIGDATLTYALEP